MTSASSADGDEPLVSIIMAVLDGEEFLEQTLDSVFAQTYPSIELVLADGGSTDRTLEIARHYADAHPGKLRVIDGDPGSSPIHRRNQAIDAANGSLLCWLDADDLWMPTKVESQVAVMRARPGVGLVYTRFEAFDSASGDVLYTSDPELEVSGDLLAPLFLHGCFVGALTTMFRRAVLDDRGLRLREKDFNYGDDYSLWLVLALDWQAVFIPEMLARYRRHARNESVRTAEQMNLWGGLVGLQREFLDEHPEAGRRLGRARRRAFAHSYWRAYELDKARGRSADARRFWRRALVNAPGMVAGFTLRSLRVTARSKVGGALRRTRRSRPPASPPR